MIIIASLFPWQNRIMAQSIKDANLIQFADTALLDNWITSYTFCKVFPGWMICPNSACHLPIILSENCNLWSDENVTYKVKMYADTSFLQYEDKTSQKYLVMLLLKCRRRHKGFGHWLCTKLAVSSSVFGSSPDKILVMSKTVMWFHSFPSLWTRF